MKFHVKKTTKTKLETEYIMFAYGRRIRCDSLAQASSISAALNAAYAVGRADARTEIQAKTRAFQQPLSENVIKAVKPILNALGATDQLHLFERAFETLPSRKQQAWLLRFDHALTFKNVGEKLGKENRSGVPISANRARQLVLGAQRRLIYQIKREVSKKEPVMYAAVTAIPEDVCAWELSVRTATCLMNAGFRTLTDLLGTSEGELLRTRNFGHKSLCELREFLSGHGIHLRETINHPPQPINATSRVVGSSSAA